MTNEYQTMIEYIKDTTENKEALDAVAPSATKCIIYQIGKKVKKSLRNYNYMSRRKYEKISRLYQDRWIMRGLLRIQLQQGLP